MTSEWDRIRRQRRDWENFSGEHAMLDRRARELRAADRVAASEDKMDRMQQFRAEQNRDSAEVRMRIAEANLQYQRERDREKAQQAAIARDEKSRTDREKMSSQSSMHAEKLEHDRWKTEKNMEHSREKIEADRRKEEERQKERRADRQARKEEIESKERMAREKREQEAKEAAANRAQRDRQAQEKADAARFAAQARQEATRDTNETRLKGIELNQKGQQEYIRLQAEVDEEMAKLRAGLDMERKTHETTEEIRAEQAATDSDIRRKAAFTKEEITQEREGSFNRIRENEAFTGHAIEEHEAKTATDIKAQIELKLKEHALFIEREERMMLYRLAELKKSEEVRRVTMQQETEWEMIKERSRIAAQNKADIRRDLIQKLVPNASDSNQEARMRGIAADIEKTYFGESGRENLPLHATITENPPSSPPRLPRFEASSSEKTDEE